jgi:hypothetical protein
MPISGCSICPKTLTRYFQQSTILNKQQYTVNQGEKLLRNAIFFKEAERKKNEKRTFFDVEG